MSHVQGDTNDSGNEPLVLEPLADDPIAGDGSTGRAGVPIAPWRVKTLNEDQLVSATEPEGYDRASRKVRKDHERSRSARTETGRKRRRRWRAVVATLLLLVAVGLGAAGITYVMELWGGVSVPDVLGSAQARATDDLAAKGLVATLVTEPSDTAEGHVIDVSPRAGTRLEPGSAVVLTISAPRRIPEVVGTTEDEARAALEEAGAQNVRFVSRLSFEPEGTVTDVQPAAGALFMSTDEVVVVVSRQPRMPDLVGMSEKEALAELKLAEIPASVTYERASVEERLRVLRTEPAADVALDDAEATLVVGDPLVSLLRLSDVFDATAPRVRDFVVGEGLALAVCHLTDDGHLVARFDDDKGSYLALTHVPWSAEVKEDKTAPADAMGDATRLEGVRLCVPIIQPEPKAASGDAEKPADGEQDVSDAVAQEGQDSGQEDSAIPEPPADQAPAEQEPARAASLLELDDPQVDETTALSAMRQCGFDTVLGSCTPQTIVLPKDAKSASDPFYCCFGEIENCVWTVMVRGTNRDKDVVATEVVVTCAPRSTYASIDLTPFDGRVCDYVVYEELYAK